MSARGRIQDAPLRGQERCGGADILSLRPFGAPPSSEGGNAAGASPRPTGVRFNWCGGKLRRDEGIAPYDVCLYPGHECRGRCPHRPAGAYRMRPYEGKRGAGEPIFSPSAPSGHLPRQREVMRRGQAPALRGCVLIGAGGNCGAMRASRPTKRYTYINII